MDLETLIRNVPDFPVPGVLFRDITPLLQVPAAFNEVLDGLQAYAEPKQVDAIAGIESRGFILAAPLASRLALPFVPVRKPGKLPAARMSIEYALEYGQGQLDMHADALRPGQRVLLIDDLIATGGTAEASAKLVEMLGAEVAGFAFLIELAALGGRSRLPGYEVFSLLRYD